MKLKDIWGRVRDTFKSLVKEDRDAARKFREHRQLPILPDIKEHKREEATVKVSDLSRYRWVTVGYNRHERRGMAKELAGLVRQYPDNDKSRTAPPKIAARIASLKFALSGSPKNHPVDVRRTVLRSGPKRQRIKIWQTNNPLYWNLARANA